MMMSRRQFGISMLLGIGSIVLFGLLGRLGIFSKGKARLHRARYWKPSDSLAG